jgi:hypothetical protein
MLTICKKSCRACLSIFEAAGDEETAYKSDERHNVDLYEPSPSEVTGFPETEGVPYDEASTSTDFLGAERWYLSRVKPLAID